MEPYTMGIGLALQAFGTIANFGSQQQIYDSQKRIQALQGQEDDQRKQAMELDAAQRKRRIVRTAIAARSQALATATNQGAEGGSALAGAYGGIMGQTGENELGVNQNLYIGRNLFGLKHQETLEQTKISDAQSRSAFFSGLSSLGGGLVKNSGSIDKLSTYFGGGGGEGKSGDSYQSDT